jgi:serine/threonine-protein kinase
VFVNELSTGTAIGTYTVIRSLNSGGMGNVYLARDTSGNQVVLKFPHLSMMGDPAFYERYQREVQIGRALRHPAIQRVLDAGEFEGQPYFTTEYVTGQSLRTYLGSHAPLPVEEAVAMLDKLCQGVAYCHEQGVVHRDLKPENLVLTPAGEVVIIDFGIAWLRGARRITWAGLSTPMGTPDYMAPEQIQGKRGDARSDLYALGAIGCELLSGQPPYSGDNPLAVMSQHLSGTLRPLTELNPAVPVTLDWVLRKALCRQPNARYQTVEAFRQALLHHPEAEPPMPEAKSPRGLLANRPWLRQWLRTLGILLALLLGLVLVGVLLQLAHGAH